MGPIAFDCPHGSMHINENCYVELIADNKPVSPGEKGEVVLTHLHNFAMPFIRYKITDLATESTKICSCGRGLPVMQGIDGRANDLVVTSEGGFVTDAFFEFLLQDIPQVARFQIYQPNLENLQVTLELREQLDRSSLDSLHKKLMEPFNSQIKIEICIVDEIKHAASGKFRVVISDVQNNLLNNSNTTDF
jgi:phenylacetate-CoA ligase